VTHPLDLFMPVGAVAMPSAWFDSGCGGPRARWTAEGLIEVEGEGAKSRALPADVKKWRDLIITKSTKYGVPAQFTTGIMGLESSGDQNAKSPANACGLMQLIPSTASDQAGRPVTCAELLSDADLNVDLGTKFLAELLTKYGNNPIKVAAAYNAGSAKCGMSSKCTSPNRWNLLTDCGQSGASADYPGIVFGYTNAAAAWLGANPTVSPSSSGPSLGALVLGTAAAGGLLWAWGAFK